MIWWLVSVALYSVLKNSECAWSLRGNSVRLRNAEVQERTDQLLGIRTSSERYASGTRALHCERMFFKRFNVLRMPGGIFIMSVLVVQAHFHDKQILSQTVY